MNGVEVKDRQYRLRVYPHCFLGSEAVSWMVTSGLATSEGEAIYLCNRMIEEKMIRHVCDDHGMVKADLFYQFILYGPADTPISEYSGFIISHLECLSQNIDLISELHISKETLDNLISDFKMASECGCPIIFSEPKWIFTIPQSAYL